MATVGFRLQITPYPGCVLRGRGANVSCFSSQTSCDFMDVLNAIKKAGSLLKNLSLEVENVFQLYDIVSIAVEPHKRAAYLISLANK
ncbi:hypothetical protein H5410_010878 [Solanum commersonii]|uniref:Uncharacterized protein n=1 Tax=Solanum commersonii TaxID=4109 RepID=A0A9J6AMS4_SOLCO|nr:hypothetical protein H5410_010878 [Solanum commersonii]